MRLVVDQSNFAVLVASNGSLFEIYAPGSSGRPWRYGQGGWAVEAPDNRVYIIVKIRTISLIDSNGG
jgi:hypothetical protein